MLCNSISYLVGNGHCSKVDTMFQHGQWEKDTSAVAAQALLV